MNTELLNFTQNLENLSAEDMFKISQELNTIEPSVGEVASVAGILESLTFLDWVSVAFIATILFFSIAPAIKKSKFVRSLTQA